MQVPPPDKLTPPSESDSQRDQAGGDERATGHDRYLTADLRGREPAANKSETLNGEVSPGMKRLRTCQALRCSEQLPLNERYAGLLVHCRR